MTHFKLVTGDLAAAERFYTALGLICVSRNLGGEDEFRQAQSWMTAPGAPGLTLILSHFPNCPPPPRATYPGAVWLVLSVEDVDATLAKIISAGGHLMRTGEDRPEHKVRAAVAADPEFHPIELVGPMLGTMLGPMLGTMPGA
jgi:predicted enzyme related to lactoylglutathione lyase